MISTSDARTQSVLLRDSPLEAHLVPRDTPGASRGSTPPRREGRGAPPSSAQARAPDNTDVRRMERQLREQ